MGAACIYFNCCMTWCEECKQWQIDRMIEALTDKRMETDRCTVKAASSINGHISEATAAKSWFNLLYIEVTLWPDPLYSRDYILLHKTLIMDHSKPELLCISILGVSQFLLHLECSSFLNAWHIDCKFVFFAEFCEFIVGCVSDDLCFNPSQF